MIKTLDISEGTGWSFNFDNLDKFDKDGNTIQYSVSEDAVANYKSDIDQTDLSNVKITNSRVPEVTQVKGTKTWDDKDNQDGVRPTEIKVNLLADGKPVTTKTVTAADNWTYSFDNLPKFAAGKVIQYIVTEDTIAEYSTKTDGFNLINEHTPGKTSVTVTKSWVDNNNQDGLRPASIQVQLYGNDTAVGDAVTLDQNNNWTTTFSDLALKSKGQDVIYTIKEVDKVAGYDAQVDDTNKGNVIITNTHTPELTQVKGTKTWDDQDNQDGIRPTEIKVNLLADGQPVTTKTVTAADNWTYSFDNLPKFEAGKAIQYTVTEDAVAEYSTKTDGFNLINQRTPGKTSVTVTKSWVDNNNQDGLRPASIQVQLYGNGSAVGDAVTLDQNNNWTTTFSDLALKSKGQDVIYTIKEVDKVTGYDTYINDTNKGNVIITNTHTPELTQVKGSKTWDDQDDQDGVRPTEIKVNLLADGQPVTTKTVTVADNWSYSFDNLPKFEAGKAIQYTVTEDAVAKYSTKSDGFNLINERTPGKTSVTVTKSWLDNNNQDGLRAASIQVQLYGNGNAVGDAVTLDQNNNWTTTFSDLALRSKGKVIVYTVKEVGSLSGYQTTVNDENKGNIIITNSHTPELTKVTGTKTWSDNDNQDGIRPEIITVNLLADGKKVDTKEVTAKDDWKYSFVNLPKFAAGKAIVYTVSEATVAGYDVTINDTDLTNTHAPEMIAVNGTKTWNDSNNQDGIRPNSIMVNLLANGKIVSFKEVKSTDNWQYKFVNLPKFEAGKAIVYTVSEATVAGYQVTVNGTNLTNTHTAEVTKVIGTKTWSDNDNQDGLRPEKITVNLLADGKQVATKDVTAEANWTYSFANLPKFAAGKAIVYTVSEAKVAGYDVTVNGTDLTNTHTPEMTTVEGTKTWSDKDNQDGVRPDKITVNLLADGKPVATKDVTAKDDWKYSFAELPKFEAGKAIVYTVSEATVAGYDVTVNGTDLTNTHTPEMTTVEGRKTWSDNNNQDGLRPDKITVNLLADGKKVDGKKVDAKEVTAEANWTYSFANLPKFEAGKAIVYTVSEAKVAGYDVTVNGTDLTNTHTPEMTTVEGTKTWSDKDNQDGLRPDKITVNLLADGKQVATKEVTAKDDWKYSFAELPKFEAGKAIVYTVSEATVAGYEVTVNGTDLTNTHAPEITTVNGTKTWNDNNNQDGLRPEKITVNLLADGKQVATKDVTAKDDWKYSFANLPKFAAGKAIVYTVSEAKVAGYDVTVNGTDLTNTHTPEMTTVEGSKTWSDKDNQDGVRPDKITVNLLADGKQVATKDVTAKDDWKYSFANLPKFEAGKAIVYTVTEDTVAEYSTTTDKFNLINEHTPGKTSVTVTKSWNDTNDQDGIRPTSIQVQLFADNKPIGKMITLNQKNKWTTTFSDLALKSKGKAIVYTVKEVGSISGYQATVNDENKGNIIITNTHTPEMTTVNGTKTWNDNNNQDGLRPEKITVNLLADGKPVATKDVTAEANWTYSFANLPKFAAGKAIVYTISEAKVAGYDVAVNGTDLTNTHTPEMTTVEGTKTWSDNNNQDGLRPGKIIVYLKVGDEVIRTKEVTAKENWKYSFANLPQFEAGKAIVYTISEATVAGYDVTVKGYDLTNTHTPVMTTVEGTKTWNDNNNQDGLRPEKITVNLLADGKKVDTKDVTAKDDWKYSFANLPKFAAGKAIVYTISEAKVAGYDVTVKGYDLTNTLTPKKPNKPVKPTTPNKPKSNHLPKTAEMMNNLYNLIGFVMITLAGFGLVLSKKGKL